jgi:hypothetical protein
MDPNKIKAMREWKIPKTLKKLRGFLGLIGYYRNFVENYGQIVAPLTTLLKKEAFSWNQVETKYFEKFEDFFETLVLSKLDFTKTFILECDASGHGVGAVSLQEGKLLSFESRQLKGKNLIKPI